VQSTNESSRLHASLTQCEREKKELKNKLDFLMSKGGLDALKLTSTTKVAELEQKNKALEREVQVRSCFPNLNSMNCVLPASAPSRREGHEAGRCVERAVPELRCVERAAAGA